MKNRTKAALLGAGVGLSILILPGKVVAALAVIAGAASIGYFGVMLWEDM